MDTEVRHTDVEETIMHEQERSEDGKVVNLAVYKIKRSLRNEGFDLITDENGKLTLVLRFPGQK